MTNKNKIPLFFGFGTLLGILLLSLSMGTGRDTPAESWEPQIADSRDGEHFRDSRDEHRWRFEQAKPSTRPKPTTPASVTDTVGKRVKFTPPPLPDFSGLSLPRSKHDRMVLSVANDGLAQGQLELDPTRRDPMTSLGLCTRWIVKCVDPGTRSLDDCARSVPRCTSEKPWLKNTTCCPEACFEQYATRRIHGQSAIEAFDHVYFGDPSCFPGVLALLESP